MASTLLQSYALLIRLAQEGSHSLNDIKKKWENASFNENKRPLTTRTFHNYKNAIYEIFGIEIIYDAKCKVYRINESDSYITNEEIRYKDMVMNAFPVMSMCLNNENLSGRIVLDSNPFGQKYFFETVTAMNNMHCIKITKTDTYNSLLFSPYRIYNYESLWLVTGRRCDNGEMITVSLDEIKKFEETDMQYSMAEIPDTDIKVVSRWLQDFCDEDTINKVCVRVFGEKSINFIKRHPLGNSQILKFSGEVENKIWKEDGANIKYAIFEYEIPDSELIFFYNKVFQNLDFIQIISPEYVEWGFYKYILKIKKTFKKISSTYKTISVSF